MLSYEEILGNTAVFTLHYSPAKRRGSLQVAGVGTKIYMHSFFTLFSRKTRGKSTDGGVGTKNWINSLFTLFSSKTRGKSAGGGVGTKNCINSFFTLFSQITKGKVCRWRGWARKSICPHSIHYSAAKRGETKNWRHTSFIWFIRKLCYFSKNGLIIGLSVEIQVGKMRQNFLIFDIQ